MCLHGHFSGAETGSFTYWHSCSAVKKLVFNHIQPVRKPVFSLVLAVPEPRTGDKKNAIFVFCIGTTVYVTIERPISRDNQVATIRFLRYRSTTSSYAWNDWIDRSTRSCLLNLMMF